MEFLQIDFMGSAESASRFRLGVLSIAAKECD